MRLKRVKIDHHENRVAAIIRGLAVEQDVFVIGLVKSQVLVVMQGLVFMPYAIDPCDVVLDIALSVPIPDLVVVFFGVQVFLLALDGGIFAQLKAAVYPICCAQGCGQDEPHFKGRSATLLQYLRQDIGRVGKEIAPDILADLILRQVGKVLDDLVLKISPGKVRIRLRKAGLGQDLHHRRPGERLRQKDGVGILILHLRNEPLPERHRLGMRVVNPEDTDVFCTPEQDDITHLGPHLLPTVAGGIEVQGIDVFVLLGWIFGILDGAVGTLEKPVGIFLYIRVVGRAVDGKVNGDLHAALLAGGLKPGKVLKRAKARLYCLVSAKIAANGVWTSGVSGTAYEAVVWPLALCYSDWVDRREVDYVKAHVLDLRQALYAVLKRGADSRLFAL
ncbi:membrane protein [Candidatus Magnetobacterium bavaricum]|uniref:Membrane protein n=1 Tax=Candidatus Magnetobacterium bavaricum TaxID=29290 RepID=A0A0F3GK07_9BACT|nr:membrane protein [Candidatus Magnetobacterium bavaricum]